MIRMRRGGPQEPIFVNIFLKTLKYIRTFANHFPREQNKALSPMVLDKAILHFTAHRVKGFI